jgi:predicted Zn-dependent peptidase
MAFRPNHTILFVYGDFKPELMQKKIESFFSNWVSSETKSKMPHALENQATFGKILLIDKASAVQAKIIMGYQFTTTPFWNKI